MEATIERHLYEVLEFFGTQERKRATKDISLWYFNWYVAFYFISFKYKNVTKKINSLLGAFIPEHRKKIQEVCSFPSRHHTILQHHTYIKEKTDVYLVRYWVSFFPHFRQLFLHSLPPPPPKKNKKDIPEKWPSWLLIRTHTHLSHPRGQRWWTWGWPWPLGMPLWSIHTWHCWGSSGHCTLHESRLSFVLM